MGQIIHWVMKIDPTLLLASIICAVAFVVGMAILAARPGDTQSVSVHIDNKGDAKAYRITPDGQWERIQPRAK